MIKIKKITSIEEAEKVWRETSPDLTIYDNWDFRFYFYKNINYPILFLAGYDEKENLVGLLPLQYHPKADCWEYFAEEFCEDNRLFIKDGWSFAIPEFYKTITEPIKIDDIVGEDDFTKSLPLEDYKYILRLDELENFDNYLDKSFAAKRRRQFRKWIKEIEENKIEILKNNKEDLDLLFELSTKRYKEDSYLQEEHQRKTFKGLLASDFDIQILTLLINDKKEGVSYSILYKDIYYYFSASSNLENFPNSGSYLNIQNINHAISLGAKVFDAGLGSCHWKELMHLEKIPQYSYYANLPVQ